MQEQKPSNVVVTTQPQQVVVVNNQPVALNPPLKPWKNGLFGCFKNCKHCLCAMVFSCCYAGVQASRMNDSCCGACYIYPMSIIALRAGIRHKHALRGDLCTDCCISCCCPCCQACQLYNE